MTNTNGESKLAELILKELEAQISHNCAKCPNASICESGMLFCKDSIIDAIQAIGQ